MPAACGMADSWQSVLDRWSGAGLLDAGAAERIRAFEATRDHSSRLRWPTLLAIAFGALMLAAGVLLFVSAHWDELSPAGRFSLVLLMVAIFHVGGAALSQRSPAISTALHGVGTMALGAGIFLAAQIFNLQEHWPGGILLWALGAWIGWWLLRDWVQGTLVALLTPAWLAAEWIDATDRFSPRAETILSQALFLLALTYLTARFNGENSILRRSLVWIGGIVLIPAAAGAAFPFEWDHAPRLPLRFLILGTAVGYLAPLALAVWLRRRAAWMNAIATLWVVLLGLVPRHSTLLPYLWCALTSLGLIAWGLEELRRERINLGVLGFGLTVLAFYFSNVMDKLGRSASLIGLGLLFLLLAWGLERARRQLVARTKQVPA